MFFKKNSPTPLVEYKNILEWQLKLVFHPFLAMASKVLKKTFKKSSKETSSTVPSMISKYEKKIDSENINCITLILVNNKGKYALRPSIKYVDKETIFPYALE